MRNKTIKSQNFPMQIATLPNIAAICFCILACAAGAGIAVFGSGSQTSLVMVSVGIIAVCLTVGIFVYDLPVVFLTRIVFIASFFFKSDVSILKIDENQDPSGLNISLTLVAAVILFISDFYNRERSTRIFPFSLSIVLTALTFCAAMSVFYGTNGKLGWYSFFAYSSSVFICFVVASHFGKRENLKDLVLGIACGITLTGLTSVSQFFVNFPKMPSLGTGTEEELLWTQAALFSRVSAFMRTPTEMGWVVSTLIPLIIAPIVAYVREFSTTQRVILAISSLMGITAIVLSLARGSWLALIAGILILVSWSWKNWERSERKNYFYAVGGGVLLFAMALAPFGSRIYERLTTDDGSSAAIRIPLMQVAVNMIEDNALTGVGLNDYRNEMPRYDDTKEHVTQIFPGPVHNSFAQIMAEVGIPGGIFFGILLLIGIFECWQTMRHGDKLLFALALGALAAIIAYIISAIKEPGSLGSVRPPIRTFFFLLGFIMALSNCRNNQNRLR